MRLRLSEAERITGGALRGDGQDAVITGASIDSRHVSEGNLFAALRGEFLDGHDFVNHAFDQGASVAIVERDVSDPRGPLLRVEDTLRAITRLASYIRDTLDPIVVGITGSTGKTSTRDLLASVTSRKFRTISAEKNFNNEIGLPLTLLRIAQETEVVLCELGARGSGHIRQLCDVARPQVGIVTNVGVSHYELFKTREEIAASKSELVKALPEGGSAILNADDRLVAPMARETEAHVITFGKIKGDVVAQDVKLDSWGRPRFRLFYRGERLPVELLASGLHQVENAAAAAAAGIALGLSLEECGLGLEDAQISPWRMQVSEQNGVIFVNDAYNSAPSSAAAAIESCALMLRPGGRLIAVLGHMAELGDIEEAEHRALGERSASTVDHLVVVGERASLIAEGARGAGAANVDRVASADQAVDLLLSDPALIRAGDVVLVKGSRVAGLEKVIDSIQERMSV